MINKDWVKLKKKIDMPKCPDHHPLCFQCAVWDSVEIFDDYFTEFPDEKE